MKQQGTDISDILHCLSGQLDLMQRTIDSQHTEICSLTRNVDKLLKENRELRKRLEKYENPPKDSGNSSTPPSKEPMKAEVVRRTKSLRQKSGRPATYQTRISGISILQKDLYMWLLQPGL